MPLTRHRSALVFAPGTGKQRVTSSVAVLVVVVVTGGIVLNILAYRHAYAMTHFTAGKPRTQEPEKLTTGQKVKVLLRGVNIPRPQTRASPTDLGPATRSLRLDGTDPK